MKLSYLEQFLHWVQLAEALVKHNLSKNASQVNYDVCSKSITYKVRGG